MFIDLPDVACKHLVELGYDAHLKRLDAFTGKEGVIVRRIPSAYTTRYYNGSLELAYIYQVIVRRKSERLAMAQAEEIADALDGLILESENGSYKMTNQQIYTPPSELILDDAGFFAWEFRMRALLDKE